MLGWIDAWNSIIRNVIFPDAELKKLMMIPENTNIIQFNDRYFIKAGYANKLLTDEHVRISYADIPGSDTAVPSVRRNMMTFDIYCKIEDLHNISNEPGSDRLRYRTYLIGARLKQLLMQERHLNNTAYHFEIAGDWDLGTRTVGYARYTIAFYYMKAY